MSNELESIPSDDDHDPESTPSEEVGPSDLSQTPKPSSRLRAMLEGIEMEMLSAKRGSSSGFSMSELNEKQRDKTLDIIARNEENSFKYHSKKLDVVEKINLKQIEASSVGNINIRYIVIVSIVAVFILTILILFFKSEFFLTWLSFLTGLAGGFGLSKASNGLTKQAKLSDPTKKAKDDDDDDD